MIKYACFFDPNFGIIIGVLFEACSRMIRGEYWDAIACVAKFQNMSRIRSELRLLSKS